ncbi:hypothetical protein GCM10017600_25630 [Streptosporangium carneum]|uniref:Uncharacterized protein n=1 Tax=Streptosporangium carneum TaxID=47481 RepID=A0A9W6HZZ0_9ACTN|nr:hypothetical protein GCM10017600_25630 [Streptosporangium carneum]
MIRDRALHSYLSHQRLTTTVNHEAGSRHFGNSEDSAMGNSVRVRVVVACALTAVAAAGAAIGGRPVGASNVLFMPGRYSSHLSC